MLNLEFSIASIATFVGILDQITKTIFKTCDKKNLDKFIPVCSIVYGLALGIAGYFIPSVEMGNNIIEAIFIGLSAGAASTGVHQIYHQQVKPDEEKQTTTTDDTNVDNVTTVEETVIVNESNETNEEEENNE